MKLSASVLAGVVPAETPKRKASVAPISLSDAFSPVTFRAKAANSVDDATSYAESHGLSGERIQAELTAAGVKQAEFNPADNQEKREDAKAKETPDFALQQPELDEPHPPLPPLRLSGSLRAIASAFPVGSTAYDVRTGLAMRVVASNLVGEDMLILRAKTASGVERHVVSSKTGLTMVPAPLRRLFAALKEAAGTYFDLYVKTAIQKALLPVDDSMNWDALLLKVYRKFNWTKDPDTLEQAIYDMLTQMLYAPGDGPGAKGLTILQKFNPAQGDSSLPLEKQVSNFLMSRLLPYHGKPSAGSDIVRRSIDKQEREITENRLNPGNEDYTGDVLDSIGVENKEVADEAGVAGMAVDSLRTAFSAYVSRKNNASTASRLMLLFDIYVDNPHKGDAAAAASLAEWEAATGTGKLNYYRTRRALAAAISAFANSSGAPAGEGFRSLVNALKRDATTPVPDSTPVSVEASDITPDNIVMPDIDQKEADMRPTIRERQAAKKAPRFAALKRFAEEEPAAIVDALVELKEHYQEQLEKVEALVEHLTGDTEGEEPKEASAKKAWSAPKVGEIEHRGDEAAGQELRLYIENDSQLYHSQMMPIIKNVQRRKAKGTYDPSLAPKLWMYLVDAGAKKYLKEFGAPGDKIQTIFPKPVRMALAEEMAKDYSESIDNGEYDSAKQSSTAPRFSALRQIATEEPEEVQEALQELYEGADTTAEYLEALAENLGVTLEDGFGDDDGDTASVAIEASAKQAGKLRHNIELLPNGGLKISDYDGYAAECRDIFEFMEDATSNGWDWLPPEKIGALTDAPIITNDVEWDENRDEIIGLGDLWWYPQYELYDPLEEIQKNGFVVFTKAPDNKPTGTDDPKTSSTDKTAGPGAGITLELKGLDGHISATYDPATDALTWTSLPEIDSFDCHDYSYGLSDVRGDLLKVTGVTIEDEAALKADCRSEEDNPNGLPVEIYFSVESFSSFVRGGGYTRSPMGAGEVLQFPVELRPTFVIDGHELYGNYVGATIDTVGTEEFGYFYEDVFDFMPISQDEWDEENDGEWLDEATQSEYHQEDNQANYSKTSSAKMGSALPSYFVLKAVDASGKATYFDGKAFAATKNAGGLRYLDEEGAKSAAKTAGVPEGHTLRIANVKAKEAMPATITLPTKKIEECLRRGRPGRLGNLATDGKVVTLHGNPIFKIEDGKAYGSWAGWATPTTARNVNGLSQSFGFGSVFNIKNREACFNGTPCDVKGWMEIGPVSVGGSEVQASAKKADDTDWRVNDFVRSYLETALWSSSDNFEPNGGEPLDSNFSIDDIDNEGQEKATADCKAFIEKAGDLLDGLDDSQVAHDFWLTRNGHGAGFWDGDYPEEIGEKLTEVADSFGEVDLYVVVYSDKATDAQVPVGEEDGAEEGEDVRDKIRNGEYEAVIYMS